MNTSSTSALDVQGLGVRYGAVRALNEITLKCPADSAIAIIGPNAAGKSSLLGGIAGIVNHDGEVRVSGDSFHPLPAHRRARSGLCLVPEQRQVFAEMSVEDNLLIGAYPVRESRSQRQSRLDELYDIFPVLRERRRVPAGVLSGGEQQMAAIARGLMSKPRVLLMDEPTLGLAPRVVENLATTIRQLRSLLDVLIIAEQNVRWVAGVCDEFLALSRGREMLRGPVSDLDDESTVQSVFLGRLSAQM